MASGSSKANNDNVDIPIYTEKKCIDTKTRHGHIREKNMVLSTGYSVKLTITN